MTTKQFYRSYNRLAKYGQEHLLSGIRGMAEPQRTARMEALSSADFSSLDQTVRPKRFDEIKSAPYISLYEREIYAKTWEKYGRRTIQEGQTAIVLLAGGDGSRLGSSLPKSIFPLGIEREITLLSLHFKSLIKTAYDCRVAPVLFVIVSPANQEAIRTYLAQRRYFGYPSSRIFLCCQKALPCLDRSGKAIWKNETELLTAPDGNGGFLQVIQEQYATVLRREHIVWLQVNGIDNALQRMCDPVSLGAAVCRHVSSLCKIVKKRSEDEKVGELIMADGTPAVVEYYERGSVHSEYGAVLSYWFHLPSVDRAKAKRLPYHSVEKQADVRGEKKLVYKSERLMGDFVSCFPDCLGMEVEREREFAPVKNATGEDSILSAQQALRENHFCI